MNKPIAYLDNASTTFCSKTVAAAMAEFLTAPHGNPSGVHRLSQSSCTCLKEARKFFAETFQVEPPQVTFTSGGTESNNLAISGLLKNLRSKKNKTILTTPIEHSSVLRVLEAWQKEGFTLVYLKLTSEGLVDLNDLKSKLSSQVCLVSVMAVNNEIGTIQPIAEIGALLKKQAHKIYFHVDAIQAFGKMPLSFKPWHVDLMSLSSHKIHGPHGAGALIRAADVKLEPLVYGGNQERGLRSGTESLETIYGFQLAAREAIEKLDKTNKKVSQLNALFRNQLKEVFPEVKINSPQNASAYIVNASFCGYPSEVLLRMLQDEGVYVSAGASCNMKTQKPSHVLSAMGCNLSQVQSALRFSFSSLSTEAEIQQAITALQKCLKKLKGLK